MNVCKCVWLCVCLYGYVGGCIDLWWSLCMAMWGCVRVLCLCGVVYEWLCDGDYGCERCVVVSMYGYVGMCKAVWSCICMAV